MEPISFGKIIVQSRFFSVDKYHEMTTLFYSQKNDYGINVGEVLYVLMFEN